MEQIAQVEIISANYLDIFRWIRKEMEYLPIKEAKELSTQKVIDFDGDYEKATCFFNYLQNSLRNSAKLIINVSFDKTGYVGATVYSEELTKDIIKSRTEWNKN